MSDNVAASNTETKRRRNPELTRESILRVAGQLMAKDGPEGLSVSKVAQLAKVNRGTAYHHFKTREQLVQETMAWVSQQLVEAIYGKENAGEEKINHQSATQKLANFAMEYPEFARVWLFEIMTSKNPYKDPFWRRYLKNLEDFVDAGLAQPELDREAYAVLMLVGTVMWPVWARSKTEDEEELQNMSRRFIKEIIRLSLYGSLVKDKFPLNKDSDLKDFLEGK